MFSIGTLGCSSKIDCAIGCDDGHSFERLESNEFFMPRARISEELPARNLTCLDRIQAGKWPRCCVGGA
jgi:hypothetical protein